MKIRLSKASELYDLKAITEACTVAMEEKGIFQWNKHYPSLEKLKGDIERKELYVLEENKSIFGLIVLTDFMDAEYIPVRWLTENGKNLYIHRLAIHPYLWGKGYGQTLMDFAENRAKEQKYYSIRLDAFSQNPRNIKFYETRGFQRLEEIYFPRQSEYPFYCYELVLLENYLLPL